jgi:hypothetical protein
MGAVGSDVMYIGEIVQLQIQRSSLKIGKGRSRQYDPAPIRQVPVLDLDPGGVVGRDENDLPMIDVHHRDHPMSKNRDGDNGISIGFTSHYQQMRLRVGDHLLNGLAGENILVETGHTFTAGDLPERLVVETADGREIQLVQVMVAEPCVEFTRFAMQFPPDAQPDRSVTETLEFLRRGMRGYYATYLGAPQRIAVGDRFRMAR